MPEEEEDGGGGAGDAGGGGGGGGGSVGERGVEQVELRERVDHDRDARLGPLGR